uniref:Calpain catalytic domain-containing protein n=1 Tax=Meloidogyne enterolobii TaxID=390850 RepID=A0A6V7VLK3_MELEN|nr:unnamed protein product [Meloidogyne enterolobii]
MEINELHQLAQIAVKYDDIGDFNNAIIYYSKAANQIFKLIENKKIPQKYKEISLKYLNRCEELKKHVKPEQNDSFSFVMKALEYDEKGNYNEALNLYTEGAELGLLELKSPNNPQKIQKLKELTSLAIERAEKIKSSLNTNNQGYNNPSAPILSDDEEKVEEEINFDFLNKIFPKVPINEFSLVSLNNDQSTSQIKPKIENKNNGKQQRRRWSDQKKKNFGELSQNEISVLATTSLINNRKYIPFIEECDLKNESFFLPIPFTDKDGLLPLSEKQKKNLKGWLRFNEFIKDEPKIIDKIDSGTIKQTIVSDCSFVASLAIAARYERRFGIKLITHIIYPQNKNGDPLYNPSGKYMVRLHINGIWRKIIIDDLLPIGKNGELLCSYSQNRSELWVSLLEKAYLKVMGGYDFPGSSSNIDLHSLTGWIPERIPIRPDENELFDASKVFERLFAHFHQGHCLITLATGHLDKSEQERTGLVDAHAYAVLDLRKIDGKCLLLVKNPWTHLRWKGRYSESDSATWTPELCAKLDYNPKDAQQFDDGVFWIDYPSVCAFFDVFYVNWNPKLFPFSYVLHSSWHAGMGPIRDLYTIGENPQYLLEVNNKHGTASVWILLTRHITDKDDFANNKEYITVIVYKNEGKRVYLPHEPKPILEGTRINSPHYLCQLIVRDPGTNKFTLVLAQYEKMKTIYYSLRIFSSSEFKCGNIPSPYKYHKKETGNWKGEMAGGCGNDSNGGNFRLKNPLFHIEFEDGSDENEFLIDLKGPKEYSIGLEFNQISSFRKKDFERKDSGPFRRGCTILQLEKIPAGIYSVQPMTFQSGQEGPFILSLHSSCDFKIKRIQ